MRAYLARRLMLSVVVIFGVTIIAFAAIQLIPADAVDVMLGQWNNPEAAAALRAKLGLDQPPARQYFRWLAYLARGDLGLSLRTRQPVTEALLERVPVTVELALLSILIAMLVGIPAGMVAAIRQYSLADRVSTALAMLGLSMPQFWLATLLIILFSLTLKVLPPGGHLATPLEDPVANLKRMIMPALSMGLPAAAMYLRMTRSSMLEVIRSEYMVTAYSKGLSERRVIVGHALKNALIPVATVTGLQVTWMLGGSFIIETIFSLPGLGKATVEAIFGRDYTMLQGCLLVYSLTVVAISLLIDVFYAWLDPRIRYE
jgi:peptide/nickel transport system permease protein